MTTTVLRLLALGRVPRFRIALTVLLGTATVVFGIGLMATAGFLISRAAERPAILSLTVAIVGVRFFGLARPLARYLERLTTHDLAFRVLGGVRTRVYERIEPLAPAELECYRHGDLLSRVVADVDALQDLHLRCLGPPLVALLTGAVSVAVATAFLPAAGIVLAAGLLVGGLVVPALAAELGRRAGRRQAAARGELTAELVELLRGAPELVAYGREEDRIARVRDGDRTLARLAERAAFADGAADGLRLLVTGATVAGVLAAAIAAHSASTLDRVLIATLALLALSSFEAVAPLPAAARTLSATLAAGRRVLELTDRRPLVSDPAAPVEPPSGLPTIALEHVTARYRDASRPALNAVSLRLEPGRRVALVGPSGAGKTTVVNLLFRFLDPAEGRVTIDGRDIREYRQEDVRRTFALAGQEAHLFDSTIRENLRLARPSATDAELHEVLRLAHLDELVASLPEGLETLVGEEGARLSGGQRQRLVLGRALLADAPVLVLDEPTAHLDPQTATVLMDDVIEAAAGRCLLLITHRPEGLEHMDEVVELAG